MGRLRIGVQQPRLERQIFDLIELRPSLHPKIVAGHPQRSAGDVSQFLFSQV
jgi:hypothetical protein